ncbi:HAD family hydrolase [Nitrosomonas sp. wSCUT-2]
MNNDELLRHYTAKLTKFKIVSFDIFDTLIHRAVHRPTDLFDTLSARLRHNDFGLMYPEIASGFAHKRIAAETEARARLTATLGTPEVGLQEIYDVLAEHLDLSQEQRQYLIEQELELEEQFCHPNPIMQMLFPLAGQNDRRIVLCSDMYLPPDFIEKLLTKCGYIKPYTLLVSGDRRKSKHEGSMYHEVLQHFSAQPHDVIHFGDNAHADVKIAKKIGIQPEFFNYLQDRVEPRLRIPLQKPAQDGHVWSLMAGSIRQLLMEKTYDFWEDAGLQIFGPLILGKVLWMTQLARRHRIERMLFFARDAYLFHNIFERYQELLGRQVELKYCFFSRAALLLPSFVDMPPNRVLHLFSGKITRSVSYHLRKLGINPNLHLLQIKQAGFESEDEMVSNGDTRMLGLLNSLWHNILLEAKRIRSLPLRYVNELAEGATNLGIVDIGWTGNMQGGFARLLQLTRVDFQIYGYYLGTFDMLSQNYLPRNNYQGYLVNENKPAELCESLINGGVELLEFALMAPHGTTLGYREQDGRIVPVLEENKADQAVQELAQRVQSGALDFIDRVLPQVLAIGIDSFVSQRWADPFFRLVNDPSWEEANMLGELTHSDTASDTSKRLFIAEKLPDNLIRKRGKEFREARQRAYWKKAFDLRNA